MDTLTKDPLTIIFSFMTFDEARTMCLVNKVFNRAWQVDRLWELWAKQEFGDVDLQLDVTDPTTWKAFFKIWWTGKRMAMNMQHVRRPGSFYNRSRYQAAKFLVGDRFIKLRHGDLVENETGEHKIWHAEKGFMKLLIRTDQSQIIPSEFSYPAFHFFYWNSVIGSQRYSIAISMPPDVRKAMQIELKIDGTIEYYIDPRVSGIRFVPVKGNYVTPEAFNRLFHEEIIDGKSHFYLRCTYVMARRSNYYEMSLV